MDHVKSAHAHAHFYTGHGRHDMIIIGPCWAQPALSKTQPSMKRHDDNQVVPDTTCMLVMMHEKCEMENCLLPHEAN